MIGKRAEKLDWRWLEVDYINKVRIFQLKWTRLFRLTIVDSLVYRKTR